MSTVAAEAEELLRGVSTAGPRKHYRMGELVDPDDKPWADLLDRPVETVTTNVL